MFTISKYTYSHIAERFIQDNLFKVGYDKIKIANMSLTEVRKKRAQGRFFTAENPFSCQAFSAWSRRANLPNEIILEPFAGANSIVEHLVEIGKAHRWESYDIEPRSPGVKKRDTIADFPRGYNVCVTNPPWLAKNSAVFRGLPFPDTQYDDLYKLALAKCLENCGYVAALVPESFIRADLYQERLHTFVSLTRTIFNDTNHPVGLALFDPNPVDDVIVYSGKKCVGTLAEIKKHRPPIRESGEIKFNKPEGNLGLIALDNTKEASIRFCEVDQLRDYPVKNTCRHITKLSVPWKVKVQDCNAVINSFRTATQDVLLTSYRGIRKDGMYRRRLDWNLARDIIYYVH